MPLKAILKILLDKQPRVGSIVKFRDNIPPRTVVGEVCGFVGAGDRMKYEIIMLDKRLNPMLHVDGTYKRRNIPANKCKHVDIQFVKSLKKDFEIGDVVCNSRFGIKKFGVITSFIHPDGLESTSYTNGYNGTDLICCVEIKQKGLARVKDKHGKHKQFITTNKRLKICKVDLWSEQGSKIIYK